MGDNPLHGPGPGGVPTQGSQKYHWEKNEAAGGWELGVPDSGDGYIGHGVQGYGRIFPKEA